MIKRLMKYATHTLAVCAVCCGLALGWAFACALPAQAAPQPESLTATVKVQKTCGTCTWTIDSDGVLTIEPIDGTSGIIMPDEVATDHAEQPKTFNWHKYAKYITGVVVKPGVSATSLEGAFLNFTALTSVDLSGLDTSETTSMAYMFCNCPKLTSVDLSGFNTANVTDMRWMFEATGLKSLDLSGFNTSKVTTLCGTFGDTSALATLNLAGWDTSNVTDMQSMFAGSAVTSLDLSSFNTAHVTTMARMFSGCLNLTTFTVGAGFVQPQGDGLWSAPPGTSWQAASDGKTYWGYGLAHRVGADSYTRTAAPFTDGWHKVDGFYYYFDSDGSLRTNSWAKAKGVYYYLGADGRVVTNSLVAYLDDLYYVGDDGRVVTSSWKKIGSDYYYFGARGKAYREQWLLYNGASYYFGNDGRLYISRWLKEGDKAYYFGADAKMVTKGWAKYKNTWYYLGASGAVVKTGWATYKGNYYFMDNYTPIKNAYITVDGVRYFANGSGVISKA